jgi:hypothetical protein
MIMSDVAVTIVVILMTWLARHPKRCANSTSWSRWRKREID